MIENFDKTFAVIKRWNPCNSKLESVMTRHPFPTCLVVKEMVYSKTHLIEFGITKFVKIEEITFDE